MTMSSVPPIRRISTEAAPTVVDAATADRWVSAPAGGEQPSPKDAPPYVPAGAERMRVENMSVFFGENEAVKKVSVSIHTGEVLALIGPSGCGKTTLLRTLNRLTELTPGARRTGRITLDESNLDLMEATHVRRRVSMVFQQPNPFPMSIFDNVAYALREQSRQRPKKAVIAPLVEDALRRAGLWDEVKENLDRPALGLSGGQQQRLCIARAIATRPEVLLMDEPCSALDPISTKVIEELISDLRKDLAIVIVTHNMQQARRIGDRVAFMYLGDLIELGTAEQVFERPMAQRTKDYVLGAFG